MRTSARLLLAGLIITAVGCASKKSPPPQSFWQYRQSDFATAPGVPVYAVVSMPEGFFPEPSTAPMWLSGGTEVALVGSYNGEAVILGFSGAQFADYRILSSEGSEPLKGKLLDACASPDGSAVALAVAREDGNGIDLLVHETAAAKRGGRVATLKGNFELASVSWLAHDEIVLAVRKAPVDDQPLQTAVHYFNPVGKELSKWRTIQCDLAHPFWNPSGTLAFAATQPGAAAVLFDRRRGKCSDLLVPGNVRFIDWSPDEHSFLYFAALAGATDAGGFAAFDYDLATGASRMIAMSSGGVTFTKNGTVAALGNRKLTNRTVLGSPNGSIALEMAELNLVTGEMQITALPLQTTPEAMALSAIRYSDAANSLAFELPVSSAVGGVDLVTFDLSSKATGLLARTLRSRTLPPMSWSPDGRLIALVNIYSGPQATSTSQPSTETKQAALVTLPVTSRPTLAILGLPRRPSP